MPSLPIAIEKDYFYVDIDEDLTLVFTQIENSTAKVKIHLELLFLRMEPFSLDIPYFTASSGSRIHL